MALDVLKDIQLVISHLGDDSGTPDRVVAIVCAAYADKYLGMRIGDAFVSADKRLKEKLLDSYGILGPLSARIDIATALVIIGKVTIDDIKSIARIRNRFAHDLAIESFDDPEISGMITGLKTITQMTPLQFAIVSAGSRESFFERLPNRAKFVMNAMAVCAEISTPYLPYVVNAQRP
jgi:hypothetical protein